MRLGDQPQIHACHTYIVQHLCVLGPPLLSNIFVHCCINHSQEASASTKREKSTIRVGYCIRKTSLKIASHCDSFTHNMGIMLLKFCGTNQKSTFGAQPFSSALREVVMQAHFLKQLRNNNPTKRQIPTYDCHPFFLILLTERDREIMAPPLYCRPHIGLCTG